MDQEESQINQEDQHLKKLKQKIEERKKANQLLKKADETEIIINDDKFNNKGESYYKNELQVGENIEIDQEKDILNNNECNKAPEKNKNVEFKVLGTKDFEKKVKV